jgi:hypothetical protein
MKMFFSHFVGEDKTLEGFDSGWPDWANFRILGSFWEGSTTSLAYFFHGSSCVLILTKYGLATF